ncbi:MAG TPA: type VI secretion system-associated protein TagF [Limnobacter sp.]|nr:type VI secretion system-associated protein TagF [Limnobacter sp.]
MNAQQYTGKPKATGLSWSWYGKLPGAGDFSVSNLHPAELDCLDNWISHILQTGQQRHSQAWHDAYMAMPMLGFALGASCLGTTQHAKAHGVWMPSVDSAGRAFPLMLFCWQNHACAAKTRGADDAGELLASLYNTCVHALTQDWCFAHLQNALNGLGEPSVNTDVAPGISRWGWLRPDGTLQNALDCKGLPTLLHFEQWMRLEQQQ